MSNKQIAQKFLAARAAAIVTGRRQYWHEATGWYILLKRRLGL